MSEIQRLYFENPEDGENSVSFAAGEEGIGVNVSDEEAVGSFNEKFSCYFKMTRDQALQLREFISKVYG